MVCSVTCFYIVSSKVSHVLVFAVNICCFYLFSGFVQGEPGAEPRLMQFHPNFQHGALLTVVSLTLSILLFLSSQHVKINHVVVSSIRRFVCSNHTSKQTFPSLFSVLVQRANHPRAFLLPEHWRPSCWPRWQSTSAPPPNKTHRLCQSVTLYRAHFLTHSQPPSHTRKSLLLWWIDSKSLQSSSCCNTCFTLSHLK